MLSVKQGNIKYHFLRLWYYSTWDWTLVSQAIDEHSTYFRFKILILGILWEPGSLNSNRYTIGDIVFTILWLSLA